MKTKYTLFILSFWLFNCFGVFAQSPTQLDYSCSFDNLSGWSAGEFCDGIWKIGTGTAGRSYNNLDKSDSYLYISDADIVANGIPEDENEKRRATLSQHFDFTDVLTPILSFDCYYYYNNTAPTYQAPYFEIEREEGNSGYYKTIFSSASLQDLKDKWVHVNVCLPELRKKEDVEIRISVISVSTGGEYKIAFDNFNLTNFSASTTSSPASCFGYSDGDITITVNGAGPNYDFSCDDGNTWEKGKTSPYTFSQKTNGDYNIVVRDVVSECIIENMPVIVESPSEILFSTQTTEIKCMNDHDGTITVIPNNQVQDPLYSLNGTAFQPNRMYENLSGGEYVIKVKDRDGCISSPQTVKVGNNAWMEIESVVPSDITTCYGSHDGSIKVTARAYNSPVSYSFNGSGWDTHETKQGLAAGEYSIRIKDGKNCILEYPQKVTIKQPDPIQFVGNVSSTDVTGCYGDNNGEIEFAVTGGTAPYKCSIDGGLNFYDDRFHFDNLTADMHYIIKVQDSHGCETPPQELDLNQPSQVEITDVQFEDVNTCFGDKTGSITIIATGGSNTFNYSIMPQRNDYQPENTFTVGAGFYYPEVTDGEGCQAWYKEIEIRQPSQVSLISCSSVDELNKCHGDANGMINVQVAGGTSPYYFTIDNFGNSSKSDKKFYTFFDLPAKEEYSVQVKDDRGCLSEVQTVAISEPTQVTIEIVSQQDASCYEKSDAKVVLKAEGGTPNYSYSFTRPSDGLSRVQSGNEMMLTAGTYDFKIIDANQCESDVISTTLSQPKKLSFSPKIDDVNTCYGDKNGRILITADGGTEPYRYYLSDVEGHDPEDNIFDNLESKSYTITVVDKNNCKVESSNNFVNQPEDLVISNLLYEEIRGCKGTQNGSISYVVSGGYGELRYSVDGKNFITGASIFTGLPAGKYRPMAVDSRGCSKILPEVELTEPDKLEITGIETTDVHCFGYYDGNATIKVVGGKKFQEEYPYKFFYPDVDDPVNYDGVFADIGAGTYDIIIKDQYDCTLTTSFTINQPEEMKFTQKETTDITTCFGDRLGTATLMVSGGIAPITYTVNGYNYTESNATGKFTGLPASSYELLATDANNCVVWSDALIKQPEKISYSAKLANKIDCHGDDDATITVSVSGGTAPYKFSFDDGLTYPYTETSYNNVKPGVYYIKAQDSKGCTQSYHSEIKIDEPPLLEADYDKYDVICYVGNTGKIVAVAKGGTRPYQFSLDGKDWQYNTGVFHDLTDSTYSVLVKDANNCQTKLTDIVINRPPNAAGLTLDKYEGCSPLKVTMTQNNSGGITDYFISNGDELYGYTGPASYVFRNTTGHTQTFTIKAAMIQVNGPGCIDTATVSVKVLSQPVSNVVFINDSSVYPETTAYFSNLTQHITSAKWDFGDGTYSDNIEETSHTYEHCGRYNIVLIQNDGVCVDTVIQPFVIEGRPIMAAIKADKQEGCQPVKVKLEDISVNSDSCVWDFGDGTTSTLSQVEHTFEGAGDYEITLTAYGDCGAANKVIRTLHVYPKPSAGFDQNADTLYEGQTLRLSNQSSDSDYFRWDFGDGKKSEEKNPSHLYQMGGTFSIKLVVKSGNSCTDSVYVKNAVTIIKSPIVVFPNAFTPDADGLNDVFEPVHGDVAKFKMVILNKKGQIMYKSEDIRQGWDGTHNGIPCPMGVYVYKVNYVLRDESFYEKTGYVVLLRNVGKK